MNITDSLKRGAKNKVSNVLLNPINTMVDENLTDITTTIGSFIIRSIRGKFQRSISFTVGVKYSDNWMEEALYGILYQYNNIKGSSRLQISNKPGMNHGTGMYYKLDNGTHNLKYRNWNILLAIQSNSTQSMSGRVSEQIMYTIITYDLSPEFVIMFEKDMIAHRNSLLKIRSDSSIINVYQDLHESDGYTYWEKTQTITKRRIGTVYLQSNIKKQIIDTVNGFFASKKYYNEHGIAHNLKILLYGPPGPQPLSINIPTPNGIKKFGDLQIGDEVFSIDGKATEIEEIYEYDDIIPYVVEFNDGRKVRCGEGHKWPVLIEDDKSYDYISTEKTVEELMEYGYTQNYEECDISTLEGMRPNVMIQKSYPVHYEYQKVPVDPWTLGVILGIGEFKWRCGKHILTLNTNNNRIISKVASNLGCTKTKFDLGAWAFCDKDSNLIDDLYFINLNAGFNLVPTGEKIRGIPSSYIFNTASVRFELIKGLIDSAAEINVSNIVIPAYVSLVQKPIVHILYSLGISAESTDFNNIVIPHNMPCSRYISEDPDKDTFSYFLSAIQHNEVHITKITKLKHIREKMRCIHIKDGSHCYLTTNYIPTCNSGKDSIAKMIASEWNRNMYYVTGGKDGRFIPNAITDSGSEVNYPLFLISDIDKYPYLINEADIALDDESGKDEKMKYKQLFGNMINALDGVLSGEDRIIVMTTNHIEKFSQTILRPGRIDLKLEIGYVTPEVFRRYVWDFYKVALPEKIELKNKKLTVANMQNDVVFMKLTAAEFINKHLVTAKKK